MGFFLQDIRALIHAHGPLIGPILGQKRLTANGANIPNIRG